MCVEMRYDLVCPRCNGSRRTGILIRLAEMLGEYTDKYHWTYFQYMGQEMLSLHLAQRIEEKSSLNSLLKINFCNLCA